MNIAILVGRLTRDPEQNGSVTKFTLAVDDYNFTTKQKEAQFINCVAFGKLGDAIARNCKKGRELAINGKIRNSSWEDRTSGEKRYKTEVIVDDATFIGPRVENGPRESHPREEEDSDPGGFYRG